MKKLTHSTLYHLTRLICTILWLIPSLGVTQSLSEKLNNYQKSHFQEKIYVHTDRAVYVAGDDIWFKVYLIDSKFHVPIASSKVAYLELLDQQQKIIVRRIIRLKKGTGVGDFKIPYEQKAGSYIVRAYTNYMRNFDAAYSFNKKIQVLALKKPKAKALQANKSTTPKKTLTRQTKKSRRRKKGNNRSLAKVQNPPLPLDIQFFPEGGGMINQMPNMVAFKAVDLQGKSIFVQGTILNSKKQKITHFQTLKFGFGKFIFIPQPHENYYAQVNYQNKTYDFKLPPAKAQGFVLQVKSQPDYLKVVVQASAQQSLQNATLLGHIRGQVFINHTFSNPNQRVAALRIPKSQLSAGIMQLTFFDAQGLPYCERLAFIDSKQDIQAVKITPLQKNISTRSETGFTLSLPSNKDTLQEGSVSIAIVRDDLTLPPTRKMTIQNYLWLTSDLKGAIEQPSYYFNPRNKDRYQLLDLLLMTQGWRRFTWRDIQQPTKDSLRYELEEGYSVSGQVVKYYNRKKSVPGKVSIFFDFLTRLEQETDKDGRFLFKNVPVKSDSTVISISAMTQRKNSKRERLKKENREKYEHKNKKAFRNEALYIAIDSNNLFKTFPYAPQLIASQYIPDTLSRKTIRRTQKHHSINSSFGLEPDVVLLDEVQVTAKKINPASAINRFPGQLYLSPSKRLSLDEYNITAASAISFFDFIRGRLPGVRVIGTFPNQKAVIRGRSSIGNSSEALYLLDGSPVPAATVASLPMETIETIDVLNASQAMVYGASGNGALAIYTRKKPRKAVGVARWGYIGFWHPGYYRPKQFYVPKYDNAKNVNKKSPDLRRILYWNPSIQLTSQQVSKIDLSTSDEAARYRIEIEGITKDGKLLMGSYVFEVSNEY